MSVEPTPFDLYSKTQADAKFATLEDLEGIESGGGGTADLVVYNLDTDDDTNPAYGYTFEIPVDADIVNILDLGGDPVTIVLPEPDRNKRLTIRFMDTIEDLAWDFSGGTGYLPYATHYGDTFSLDYNLATNYWYALSQDGGFAVFTRVQEDALPEGLPAAGYAGEVPISVDGEWTTEVQLYPLPGTPDYTSQSVGYGDSTILLPTVGMITSVYYGVACRLRIYRTEEGRDADAARAFGTPYPGGRALLYDYLATEDDELDNETPILLATEYVDIGEDDHEYYINIENDTDDGAAQVRFLKLAGTEIAP